MKNYYLCFTLCLLVTLSGLAQSDNNKPDKAAARKSVRSKRYARRITPDLLRKHLYVLAADSLEGRETGTRGEQKAARYIRTQFQQIGLAPIVDLEGRKEYYQSFPLEKRYLQEAYVAFGGNKFEHLEQVICFGGKDFPEETEREVVFVGKGAEADYQGKQVENKAVVVMLSGPNLAPVELATQKGADVVLAFLPGAAYYPENILKTNKDAFESPSFALAGKPPKCIPFLVSTKMLANLMQVEESLFTGLAGKDSTANMTSFQSTPPVKVTVKAVTRVEPLSSNNVLGYLEGSDKKEEVVVITAHYDHEGIGRVVKGDSIYNGADDDASGTSAVIALAEAFSKAKKKGKGPRRSMLFMTVSGEEKGLFGSEFYTDHPVLPLSGTVTNLNVDMIGRIDTLHQEGDYIYVVGSNRLSTELHQVNEAANAQHTKLKLDYKYNDPNDPEQLYTRSDHYNFAKHNIPIIFYTSGLHADYHKRTDSADKINYEALAHRTRLIFHTAWEVANRPERLKLDNNTAKAR
jgi:hypothetical protein